MTSYGMREGHAKQGSIGVCFSTDDGKIWDISTETRLRNDFLNWDIGYQVSVELPNRKQFTVYYYNLFGKYFLVGIFRKP